MGGVENRNNKKGVPILSSGRVRRGYVCGAYKRHPTGGGPCGGSVEVEGGVDAVTSK